MGQVESGQAGPIAELSVQRKLPLPAIDPVHPQSPNLEQMTPLVQILKHPPLTSSKPAGQTQVQFGCCTKFFGQVPGHAHSPASHVRAGLQTFPHTPQLASSVSVFVQPPEQQVSSLAQVSQISPLWPQKSRLVPDLHRSPAQHPLAQLAGVQAHDPSTHI